MKRTDDVLSINDAFNYFIMVKQSEGLSEATISDYKGCFWDFISTLDISEHNFITSITYEDIMRYIAKKTCSKNSINHYITGVRVFLYWCMNMNYMSPFKIKLMKTQEEKIKYFTDDELQILLKKPNKKDNFSTWRTYATIAFIYGTGARASTVCNIKFEDIDFDNHEVTYRHLKNKQLAIIPLSNYLMSVLNEYRRMWKRTKEEWFFCDMYENQLTVNALRQSLQAYCKRRGVTVRGPHAIRHSFARGWVLNGGNAFTLQQMLTHSDLQMTKHYVRIFGTDLHPDLEKYSPLDQLKGKGKVSRV